MNTLESNGIEFLKVNHDINGNPRYVCHFLTFLNDKDEANIKQDFAASLAANPFKLIGLKYELALKKAKTIGGRKFHNKQYGGGVVFQSYNIHDLATRIKELKNN